MQRINNFGSVLQSYALKKILESYGNEVEFIDIDYENAIFKDVKLHFNEGDLGDKSSTYKRLLRRIDRYIIIRWINRLKQFRQEKIFNCFQNNILQLNNHNNTRYDLCVIGSDEVFNCLQGKGITDQLFGAVHVADNVITYAASCGYTNYEKLPKEAISYIRNALMNISCFSVRDKNTMDFVDHFELKKSIEYNLDPVLIYDFSKEIENVVTDNLPKKYCIVYGYTNRFHNAEEVKAIKKFCKQKQIEIISIGIQQKWITKHYTMEPFKLLKAFSNAEFVITDTFHGCIFSYKYAKRFCVIVRNSNANKLRDLVERIGVEKHLVNTITFDTLEQAYLVEKDNLLIKDFLETERDKSLQYLKKTIH